VQQSVCTKTVACELAKYNVDVVAVQEVRRDVNGSQPAENCTFSMEMETLINRLSAHRENDVTSYECYIYQ
jgi:hypothetical protein